MEFTQVTNYFPWDIAYYFDGDQIVNCYQEHGVFPVIAYPHNAANRSKNVTLSANRLVDYDITPDIKQELIEEIDEQLRNSAVNEDAQPFLECFKKGILGKKITKKTKESFRNLRKRQEKISYRGEQSAWPRIIGYLLWEIWSEHPELHNQAVIPISKVLEHFERTDIYKKIDPRIITVDENVIRRWVTATIESIKKGHYVNISTRDKVKYGG